MRAVYIASLAFLCAITASPVLDTDIVPENTNVAVDDDFIEALEDSKDALSGVKKTIAKMVASGKSEKDCRKLVTETRKEVTDNVDICKKTMSALPTGASCKDRGQTNVQLTLEAKTKADKHVVYTKTEVTKSEQTEVHFSSRTFSSLTEGKCSSFYSESSFTTAKTKHKAAVSAYNKAVGEANQASKSWKLAIEAAVKEKKECECKTKSDHETAFAKHSSSKTNAANQKTWTFACKVECVLDKKTSCTCDAAPMCKRPKVDPTVMEASCSKIAKKDTAPAPAPAPAQARCKGYSTSTKDEGYDDLYHGWYDVQGCGKCQDYCRWVGNSGSGGDPTKKLQVGKSWWSCRLAGSSEPYTSRSHFTSFDFKKCSYMGDDTPKQHAVLRRI